MGIPALRSAAWHGVDSNVVLRLLSTTSEDRTPALVLEEVRSVSCLDRVRDTGKKVTASFSDSPGRTLPSGQQSFVMVPEDLRGALVRGASSTARIFTPCSSRSSFFCSQANWFM